MTYDRIHSYSLVYSCPMLACTDKGRSLYKNAGGVSRGIQSLWWDWIVSTNCAGLSGIGCVACVQEVVCGIWTRLLRCGREIGVNCSLAIYSDVELAVPKTACYEFHQAARDSVCRMCGGSVKLLGWIMGSCPEVRSETTPDP